MKTSLSLFFGCVMLLCMGWFAIYKTNPARICTPHPDKAKQDTYIYCWPGFDMRTDTWVDGHSPIKRYKFLNKAQDVEKKSQGKK